MIRGSFITSVKYKYLQTTIPSDHFCKFDPSISVRNESFIFRVITGAWRKNLSHCRSSGCCGATFMLFKYHRVDLRFPSCLQEVFFPSQVHLRIDVTRRNGYSSRVVVIDVKGETPCDTVFGASFNVFRCASQQNASVLTIKKRLYSLYNPTIQQDTFRANHWSVLRKITQKIKRGGKARKIPVIPINIL